MDSPSLSRLSSAHTNSLTTPQHVAFNHQSSVEARSLSKNQSGNNAADLKLLSPGVPKYISMPCLSPIAIAPIITLSIPKYTLLKTMASKQEESGGSISVSDTSQLAHTIVMAAEERLSKQSRDQYPHNTVGFMEKAESHLGKHTYKQEGEIKKGSMASRIQSETERVKKSGKESDVERAVRQELKQRGYDLSSEYV